MATERGKGVGIERQFHRLLARLAQHFLFGSRICNHQNVRAVRIFKGYVVDLRQLGIGADNSRAPLHQF
jgi:hypothetical protein